MPHQCVRCNEFYDDGSDVILKGCSCGAKLFFFVRKEKLEKVKKVREEFAKLSPEEKRQVEEDVLQLVGENTDPDLPVILDLEAIRVVKPGQFELDLVQLFNAENPLVYKIGEGKYVIDIAESFRRKSEDDETYVPK